MSKAPEITETFTVASSAARILEAKGYTNVHVYELGQEIIRGYAGVDVYRIGFVHYTRVDNAQVVADQYVKDHPRTYTITQEQFDSLLYRLRPTATEEEAKYDEYFKGYLSAETADNAIAEDWVKEVTVGLDLF